MSTSAFVVLVLLLSPLQAWSQACKPASLAEVAANSAIAYPLGKNPQPGRTRVMGEGL